jgi:hypothetical protein
MWKIEYLGEAWHYIIDNDPYIGDVIEALENLRRSADAIPAGGAHHDNGDIIFFTVYHMLVYRRYPAEKKIVVSIIKPKEY